MSSPAQHRGAADPLQARRRAVEVVAALVPRLRPLAQAAGTVLAADLWARNPLPAFDCSAMDGYAVRGPGPWRLLGSTLAGDPAAAALPDGGAVAVATGAAVPQGCEGVLRTEDAVVSGDELLGVAPRGRDVRRRGEECPPWTPVLAAGTRLTPAALALAAALGHDRLLVQARPRVRVLVTGRELLVRGDPGNGRIRDALGPLLVPALLDCGGDPDEPCLVGDDGAALSGGLADVLLTDLVVTTGGTADGPTDGVRAALAQAGARIVLDGLATRPGRPTILSLLPDGTPVLSLPGNPLAALVGLTLLGSPVIAALRKLPPPEPVRSRLVTGLAGHPNATRVVPVRRSGHTRRDGCSAALPTGHDGAANLRGAALADGLALVPPGADLLAGAAVDVLDIPGAGAE